MKKQLLKKLCIAALGVIGLSSGVKAQQHWLAEVSGQIVTFNGEYKGNHLTVDGNGNTYTTGSIKSSATESLAKVSAYNHGQTHPTGTAAFSVANYTTVSTRDKSFIAKTNNNGIFQWMIGFGSNVSTESTITNTIAVDNANNVLYAGGNFNGTIDFASTFPSAALTNPTADSKDGLILKVTTDGAYVWHKTIGGAGNQIVMGVTTDIDGNLIVVGTYETELIIDGNTTIATSGNGVDVFIAKFNTSGTLLFVKTIGGTYTDIVYGLATDIDKSIYVSGNFIGNMTVGTIPLTSLGTALTSGVLTGTNSYLAKLDTDGNAVWAKAVSSIETNVAYSIAVDHKVALADRRVYLTGHVSTRNAAAVTAGNKINFAGIDFVLAEGSSSPYIAKFNANDGAGVWGKVFNSIGASGGYLVSVNPNNEVYFGGFARTSLNIDGYTHTNTDSGDGYILKVDEDGAVIGKKFIATVGTDYVCGLVATNTAVYANGIAGGATGATAATPKVTTNFAGTNQDYTFRGGNWDVYILKWGDATLPVSLTDFKGSKTSSGNLLIWETLSEKDNQYFEIERSTDGVNFSSIQTVNTKAASGNSTAKLSYNYTDVNPLAGVNYYRLKQVDKDGAFSYSQNIVALNSTLENGGVKLYPNPGSGNITIQFPSESAGREINVYSQAGQLIKSYADVSGNSHAIDITAQPSGVYFIQVLEKGKSNLIKYIKQ